MSDKNVSEEQEKNVQLVDEDLRRDVYRKTEGHCFLCGDFVDYNDFKAVPYFKKNAKDGDPDNLWCTCPECSVMFSQQEPGNFFDRIIRILNHTNKNGTLRNLLSDEGPDQPDYEPDYEKHTEERILFIGNEGLNINIENHKPWKEDT